MEIFRKISLVCGCLAVAVCCLFLNVIGGMGLMSNGYESGGICLIVSSALLLIAVILAFSKRTPISIIAAVLCAVGTILYAIPIAQLNSIPDAQVAKQDIEVLTGRIYPAIIATIFIACAIFANIMSYDNRAKRAERKEKRILEKQRPLTDEEKII